MSSESRILCPTLKQKIMSAEDAAAMIPAGSSAGMSGSTGAGYPKAVSSALAERIKQHNAGINLEKGDKPFRINVWTGASRAPELHGNLVEFEVIDMRLPFK